MPGGHLPAFLPRPRMDTVIHRGQAWLPPPPCTCSWPAATTAQVCVWGGGEEGLQQEPAQGWRKST